MITHRRISPDFAGSSGVWPADVSVLGFSFYFEKMKLPGRIKKDKNKIYFVKLTFNMTWMWKSMFLFYIKGVFGK